MRDLGERRVGAAPTRFDGRIRADQMRKRRLELAVLAHQRVIVGVGNLRRVLVVIEPVVPRDLLRQPHQAVGGLGFGQLDLSHAWPNSSSSRLMKLVHDRSAASAL